MDWILKNKRLILIGLLVCIGMCGNSAFAKETVSKEHWEEALNDIDYGSRKVKEKKEKAQEEPTEIQREESNRDPSSFLKLLLFGVPLATILGVICALLILGLIIYLVLGLFLKRDVRFGKINLTEREMDMVLEDIEENLHESDLDKALRLALEAGNYKAAIRIYYLAVIKDMSLKGLIRWKKDKTNYTYVNELFDTQWHGDFSLLTVAFERVWYGNINVDKASYERLTPRFQGFLNKIRVDE